jgi:hypothetical protein
MAVSMMTATAFFTSCGTSDVRKFDAVLIMFSSMPYSLPFGFEAIFDRFSNER